MSIDRDTFETSSEEELSSLSNVQRVFGLLASNPDRAFSVPAIARETGVDEATTKGVLQRLADRDIVATKGPYWAATADADRLAAYDGYSRATALFNDRFGAEDREAWLKHAPDEPHPSRREDDE
jgi:hypothetical protein